MMAALLFTYHIALDIQPGLRLFLLCNPLGYHLNEARRNIYHSYPKWPQALFLRCPRPLQSILLPIR